MFVKIIYSLVAIFSFTLGTYAISVDEVAVNATSTGTNAFLMYVRNQPDSIIGTLLREAFAGATVNRSLFADEKNRISDSCGRTARAAVDLYGRVAFVISVDAIIGRSVQNAIAALKTSRATNDVAEFVCTSFENEIRKYLVLFPEFVRLRLVDHSVKVAGPPYYHRIPESPVKAIELFLKGVTDVEVARIIAIGVVADQLAQNNQPGGSDEGQYFKTTKTIQTLARRKDLADAVQALYAKTMDKISVQAMTEMQIDRWTQKSSNEFVATFASVYRMRTLNILDETFSHDKTLKTDYENEKKKVSIE